MKLREGVRLAWLEPGSYRSAIFRAGGVIPRLIRTTVISAVVIFAAMAGFELVQAQKIGWIRMMGLAAVLWGLFLVLVWSTPFLPATVFIHDDGISRSSWRMHVRVRQHWTWDKVAACQFGHHRVGARLHRALWVRAPGGAATGVIGIDRRTSEAMIREALAHYGREATGTLGDRPA